MQQIVILGGGAAGLAAALAAAQSAPAGAVRVTVLDRNPRCGKKLLATGNGSLQSGQHRHCTGAVFHR
ncbi:MAG: FAD-dependent oxidoreductase [Faecalibacterium sp.]